MTTATTLDAPAIDAPAIDEPPTPRADHARRIEELGRIIMAYSEVTERLQQSQEQLTATVARLQDELGEKNRLLERRNRLAALGEMAAGMAHEIRNPLAGIQLYATMLSDDLADRPDSRQVVEKIRAGVRRLESLVSQVLHFTREIVAHPAPYDVVQIVRDTVELASARRGGDGPGVVASLPDRLVARVDATLFSQALLNLLCNAVDACGDDGTVRVHVTPDPARPGRMMVVVQDDGPGIPEEILDRIFNPFFTTKDTGTGLGLAIVHRIVEAHDGTITAGNAPGGGARFDMRI
jgi:signal transduction histidine kinase